jgi:hypothetical protein
MSVAPLLLPLSALPLPLPPRLAVPLRTNWLSCTHAQQQAFFSSCCLFAFILFYFIFFAFLLSPPPFLPFLSSPSLSPFPFPPFFSPFPPPIPHLIYFAQNGKRVAHAAGSVHSMLCVGDLVWSVGDDNSLNLWSPQVWRGGEKRGGEGRRGEGRGGEERRGEGRGGRKGKGRKISSPPSPSLLILSLIFLPFSHCDDGAVVDGQHSVWPKLTTLCGVPFLRRLCVFGIIRYFTSLPFPLFLSFPPLPFPLPFPLPLSLSPPFPFPFSFPLPLPLLTRIPISAFNSELLKRPGTKYRAVRKTPSTCATVSALLNTNFVYLSFSPID